MSGFDPAWLDLREGADHRSRNTNVLAACVAHFEGREALRVVDLGCGSGSNLRALAPHLPARQSWRLVDHDPVLLDAARDGLRAWAEAADDRPEGGLLLGHGGKRIDVDFFAADISREIDGALAGSVDLVTAAALFDLVSQDWMERLGDALAARSIPLLAVLTYNGVENWRPRSARDAMMRAAFHVHQARDKGFGPAAGPEAAATLSRLLTARSYRIVEGASDWRLKHDDEDLVHALVEGVAAACAETGLVDAKAVSSWRAARLRACVDIGHTDVFATPG